MRKVKFLSAFGGTDPVKKCPVQYYPGQVEELEDKVAESAVTSGAAEYTESNVTPPAETGELQDDEPVPVEEADDTDE